MSENWQIALFGAAITVGLSAVGGLLAWMFRIARDLGSIAKALEGVPELWKRMEKHGDTLDDHGKRIVGLEIRTGIKCDDD